MHLWEVLHWCFLMLELKIELGHVLRQPDLLLAHFDLPLSIITLNSVSV